MLENKESIVEVEFCRGKKCCPTVIKKGGNYIIGGEEEGVTVFNQTNWEDFVAAAKAGKFDGL